jgi:N-acylglucosamine 2-epimerase
LFAFVVIVAVNLTGYATRYERELFERVLPFWLRHSPDPEFGGYFTCLERAGAVYDTRKYVWLQGRAAWTFSKLYNEVERRPEWLDFARSCVEFLRKHARDPKGRCYFSLTRDGRPASYQRKPYAAVFMALGLSEYAKAAGDADCRREAVELFWRIDEWIRTPAQMDRPALAGAPRLRSLADVMVQALLALELGGHEEILRRSLDGAFDFYDEKRKIFLEFAGDAGLPESRLACPGSSLEVAWLLLHGMEATGDSSRHDTVLESILGALDFGWDRKYGGLYYFIDVEGRPCFQLEANMKLWWPHTEAIYALILAALMTGDQRFANWLERVDAYAFEHFADAEYGEWFGYCDRYGKLTHNLKGNNYKGAFHVPRALLLSLQRINRGS